MGFFFVQLKEWGERTTPETHSSGIVAALNKAFAAEIPEAVVAAFGPPAIPGLGTGAGFTMELQDRSGNTPDYLAAQAQRISSRRRASGRRSAASARSIAPRCRRCLPTSIASKVLKVGVPIQDVNTTLGSLLGSSYLNDFNRFGRVYKVYVQAEPEYRTRPEAVRLVLRAQREGRHGAARYVDHHRLGERPRIHEPVQPVSAPRKSRACRRRATARRRR